MGKILVIAEKPSVGRDIANVLGAKNKADGYLHGGDYVVSWAVGHLVRLYEPDDYRDEWKRWSYAHLPMIPETPKLKPDTHGAGQLKILKSLMNSPKIDTIICATDAGREGELIFRYIYQYLGCDKPVQRLWISSMTDKAIKDGFKALKPSDQYDALYQSAKCRSEADWLVGMNASRAYTLTYNALLSVGRVQTPTLAIIVNRQREIENFVSRDYYEVTASFVAEGAVRFDGKWIDIGAADKNDETKIFDLERAQEIAAKTKGQHGEVSSVEKEEKKQPPPQLYDLTELQRDANKKYGLSAKATLEAAQSLYEKRKMITYPRTDSRYITDDMKGGLPKLLERLSKADAYAEYAGYLLNIPKLPVTKRIADDSKVSDHHAIIPTDADISRLSSLSASERSVYDLIARRFLCVFYPNYIYNTTKVITTICGEPFLSRGVTVSQYGWTEVYGRDEGVSSEKDKRDDDLPPLHKGDKITAEDVVFVKKKTMPPKPYTEAALLSAMEHAGRFIEDEALRERLKDGGLGTPATRAAIIERLIEVRYIERKGKSLIPTQKGAALIDAVPVELKSPETTGKWERGLYKIAKGEMPPERFMESIKRFTGFLVTEARQYVKGVTFPPENRGKNRKGKPAG